MNKFRIYGIMIILIGIIIKYSFSIDGIEFISALFFGTGIGMLLTGRITSKNRI